MNLPNPKVFIPAVIVFTFVFYAVAISICRGSNLTASWYSYESCIKEGSLGVMANGKVLDDSRFTAASWDYDFGTRLQITNLNNRKTVVVEITDRGPSKRLYRQGRVLDLSMAAFKALAPLKDGVIPVSIERM